MNEAMESFLVSAPNFHKIVIAKDFFFEKDSYFVTHDDEIVISTSLFAYMTIFSVKNRLIDPSKATLLGVLIGSYNDQLWNDRKHYIQDIEKEQHYTHLGMSANPKCDQTFIHLRFLLQNCQSRVIIERELNFIDKADIFRERNLYLWKHRIWLMETFNQQTHFLRWIREYLSDHPSDFSAFSFYQNIMPTNYESLVEEFQQNTTDIFYYPGHEALWNHRRFLLSKLKLSFTFDKIENPSFDPQLIQLQSRMKISQLFYQICFVFNIDISLVYKRQNPNPDFQLKLENESLVIEAGISQMFAVESEAQKKCSIQHWKWIRFVYPKIFH